MRSRSLSLKVASAWLIVTLGLAATSLAFAATRAPLATQPVDIGTAAAQPLPAGQVLHLTVALAPQDAPGLKALIRGQRTPSDPDYHRFLTPAQFSARFAPSAEQAQKVVNWLISSGFNNVQLAPNRLLITAEATPAVAENAFQTTLRQFQMGARTAFGNVSAVSVPTSLGGLVTAVVGLRDVARMHTFSMRRAQTAAAAPGVQPLTPPQLAVAYNAAALPPANSATVAVFVAGDMGPVTSDLQLAQSQFDMPQVPVTQVQAGAGGATYTDTSNTTEWDLDTQSALGMSGNLQRVILYNSGTLNNNDILQAMTRWVTDDQARYASASFGECEEDAQSGNFIQALDPVLQQAVAQGQTLFAAAGDDIDAITPACPAINLLGINIGGQNITYPASSPYVVAVGATTLTTDSAGDYLAESAWKSSIGGISGLEAAPSWQQGKIPPSGLLSAVLTGSPTTRAVPDMAMDGDPASGMIAIVNGQQSVVGGTSLSAPLAMAAWARIEQANGKTVGFAPPAMYALYPGGSTGATGFHDITTGGNGTYSAAKGWDYMTGLGSINAAVLAQTLASSSAATPTPPTSSTSGTPPPPATVTPTLASGGGASSGGGALAPGLLLAGWFAWAFRRRRCRAG